MLIKHQSVQYFVRYAHVKSTHGHQWRWSLKVWRTWRSWAFFCGARCTMKNRLKWGLAWINQKVFPYGVCINIYIYILGMQFSGCVPHQTSFLHFGILWVCQQWHHQPVLVVLIVVVVQAVTWSARSWADWEPHGFMWRCCRKTHVAWMITICTVYMCIYCMYMYIIVILYIHTSIYNRSIYIY